MWMAAFEKRLGSEDEQYGPGALAEISQNRSTTSLTIPEVPLSSNFILQPRLRKERQRGQPFQMYALEPDTGL